MKSINLSILIVNYKTKDITRQCLESVLASKTHYTFEIILVDNQSADGSVEALTKKFPKITIVASHENGGFAKANNLAAKKAIGEYVWLLNSDTIIAPDTIEKLLDAAYKKHSYVASCKLLNQDGTIQPQGGALPSLGRIALWMLNLDRFAATKDIYQNYRIEPFKHDHEPEWLGGTALLVRRDLYQSLAGLDEHFFMYGEDVEFCLRVKAGHFPIHYFAAPTVVHLGQASGNSQKAILGEFAGLKYIYQKHQPPVTLFWLRVLLKTGALLRTIMYTFTGNSNRRDSYAKAFTLA